VVKEKRGTGLELTDQTFKGSVPEPHGERPLAERRLHRAGVTFDLAGEGREVTSWRDVFLSSGESLAKEKNVTSIG